MISLSYSSYRAGNALWCSPNSCYRSVDSPDNWSSNTLDKSLNGSHNRFHNFFTLLIAFVATRRTAWTCLRAALRKWTNCIVKCPTLILMNNFNIIRNYFSVFFKAINCILNLFFSRFFCLSTIFHVINHPKAYRKA